MDGGVGIHDRVGLLEAAREYRQAAELAVIGCRAHDGQDPAEAQLHVALAVPVDDRVGAADVGDPDLDGGVARGKPGQEVDAALPMSRTDAFAWLLRVTSRACLPDGVPAAVRGQNSQACRAAAPL